MKPTLQFNDSRNRQDSVETARKSTSFPRTDFHFQSMGDFSGSCQGKGAPSFRGISDEYFKKEARTDFVSEAAFFAVIAVTAAVPIIEGVRGLAQFVYGVL